MSKTKSVGAHSICARGGLSCRKRARADMESAPTFFVAGGVPSQRGPREGRIFACCACKRIYFRFRLVKNHLMWYTIFLQVHRQTRCKPATQSYRGPSGQPVANKKLLFYCRRQLRVLLGQELTRVKTHRYTGGTKQGIYNALLFFAARGYCLIRSDSAFRYGSAMP